MVKINKERQRLHRAQIIFFQPFALFNICNLINKRIYMECEKKSPAQRHKVLGIELEKKQPFIPYFLMRKTKQTQTI